MPKRKKKQSQHSRDKIADAHRRNEFFYKLNYLITALTGDPSVYRMIPESELKFIFQIRLQAPRVKFEPASLIRQDIADALRQHLLRMLKCTTEEFTRHGPMVTIDMFLTIGMSLYTYLLTLEEDKFQAAKAFKQALTRVKKYNDENGETDIEFTLRNMMSDTLDTIPMLLNFTDEVISWVSLDVILDETIKPFQYFQFKINNYQPQLKQVVVDGIARPAYEVCWGFRDEGIKKATFAPKTLGLSENDYPESLPVYIQMHALIRLYERIDCIINFALPSCVYTSLIDPSVTKRTHLTYLIDFVILKQKLGYFVASVQQGIVLVHTFLFITNNGTPEGDRLAALTKLKKLDKEYLMIDKLSSFYESDIADTPKIKQLFLDSGCIDLFNVDPNIISDKSLDKKKPLAEKIRAYLSFTNAEENMETYRKEQMPV